MSERTDYAIDVLKLIDAAARQDQLDVEHYLAGVTDFQALLGTMLSHCAAIVHVAAKLLDCEPATLIEACEACLRDAESQ